ncbi:MAG TPA: substrate-binding domain-containing protein, partial [Candidatus Limnocylindrales bacterium]|nr:substrate-binding domain-containing protein [Candidatus Limnocylindrales bacterium]
RVDGMILSLASERSPETLAVLRGLEQPFVVVDRELPAELGASAVLSDHRAGLTEAVEHLIGLGHRRIALIAGPLDVRPGYARLDALRAALAERTPDAEPIHLCGPFSPDFGERATYALLDRPRPPTAIVVGSNVLLVGCLRALAARRLAIPGDVSLVTCDDVPLAELHSPPLSAVARDTEALGRTAAELLLRRLRDEAGPERVVLPTRFVARASTGAPAERTDRHTEED